MENEKIVVVQKKSTLLLYIICLVFACIFTAWLVFDLEVGDGGSRMKLLISTPLGAAAARMSRFTAPASTRPWLWSV